MRIVLDTNVLVSALLSPTGLPDQLLRCWEQGFFTLVTSSEQLEELSRVLAYPKLQRRISSQQSAYLINKLGAVAEFVKDLQTVNYSPDPDDNVILATAIAGRATFVVTGDKRDLLSLGQVETVRVVTVAQAIELLRDDGKSSSEQGDG